MTMPTLAITGLVNTGKSSLFGALTGRCDGIAPFPFSTTETQIGRLPVDDPILEELGRMEGSGRITPAALEVMDTPARNRSGGETDTETIGKIRQADGLVVVLRAFSDPTTSDQDSDPEPAHQAQDTIVDLAINDAEVFEKALPRLRNQATSRPERRLAYQAVAKAVEITREGMLLRSEQWSDGELVALADFAPLTLKPVIWVANVGESAVDPSDSPDPSWRRLSQVVPPTDPVVVLSLAWEAEAAVLDPRDREELREAFGMGQGAAVALSSAAMTALGLCPFFTSNHRETRAWLTRRGSNAREAAGRIHSDMERGFIRAEVAGARRVIAAGGWDAARRKGVTRVEGRDYVVRSQDVLHIRFSI